MWVQCAEGENWKEKLKREGKVKRNIRREGKIKQINKDEGRRERERKGSDMKG